MKVEGRVISDPAMEGRTIFDLTRGRRVIDDPVVEGKVVELRVISDSDVKSRRGISDPAI